MAPRLDQCTSWRHINLTPIRWDTCDKFLMSNGGTSSHMPTSLRGQIYPACMNSQFREAWDGLVVYTGWMTPDYPSKSCTPSLKNGYLVLADPGWGSRTQWKETSKIRFLLVASNSSAETDANGETWFTRSHLRIQKTADDDVQPAASADLSGVVFSLLDPNMNPTGQMCTL